MQIIFSHNARDTIIRILEQETGHYATYGLSPAFTCQIGDYIISRDGRILSTSADTNLQQKLAELSLCETFPVIAPQVRAPAEEPSVFHYSMSGHTGATLSNLIYIISARHILLNRSISALGAFYVDKDFVRHLLHHPPTTKGQFLQTLYFHPGTCKGISFDTSNIFISGFKKSQRVPLQICRQLSDHMVYAAVTHEWIKPFTKNSPNKKYLMRSWLNYLGMQGEEYEEARRYLLADLPGRADRKYEKKEIRRPWINQ